RRVGFGFHDAPGHAAGGKIANNDLADQEPSKTDGAGRQFAATKPSNQHWLGGMGIDRGCFVNFLGMGAHASILPNELYRVDARYNSTKYPMFCTLGKWLNFVHGHARGCMPEARLFGLPLNQ